MDGSLSTAEFIDLYLDLFEANPNVYAIRMEWEDVDKETGEVKSRSAYVPSTYDGNKLSTRDRVAEITKKVGSAALDTQSVRAHLFGQQFIGAYLLRPDSTVKSFALDFDGKNGDPLAEAASQMEEFKREGIPVYLERSQSGNGYHIWGFLESPLPAKEVRRAIKPLIEHTDTFDRMFPNQNSVTELRPLGNLIALPLFAPRVKEGKSVFGRCEWSDIDGYEFEPFEDQKQFLASVTRIPVEDIQRLAAEAPELKDERQVRARVGPADGTLPGVKKVIDPRFGCEWVRWCIDYPEEVLEPEWYALACNLAQLKGGRDVFHDISALSSRYSADDTDRKFDQAVEKNAPHSCEYIRENLQGPKCNCDSRFDKVYHPFDLAKISVYELISSVEGDGAVTNATEGLDEAIDWLYEVEKDPKIGMGLSTGLECLDEHLGFRDATLNILAARPSVGKTGLALDLAYRMAASGIPVFFFSLEMSKKQLWLRLLARIGGVSGSKMRKGILDSDDWRKINEARDHVKSLPSFPFFVDDTNRHIRSIMEVAWGLQEEHGKGIVMIDYLGLLDWNSGENEYSATTRNSKECKLLAKALDCPNLVLHQFNRTGDDMGVDAQTFDSWLRSSGQIEQDADVILYLLGERGPGVRERMLVKQKDRDGEAGIRIPLEFNQAIMQFGAQGTWLAGIGGAAVDFGMDAALAEGESDLPWEGLG
jgi:replicative DNA helicase